MAVYLIMKSKVAESKHAHPTAVQLKQELSVWHGNQINVTLLLDRLTNVNSTNEALRRDLESLRTRLIVGNFFTFDYCLMILQYALQKYNSNNFFKGS